MRLFDFVEQHHAVRVAAHRFGQHAALAIADIARRRALQAGDAVRFLVLAHVDGDQLALAAVQQVGQRQRGLGLADAATVPTNRNTPFGLFGSSRLARAVRTRCATAAMRVRLAEDALVQQRLQAAARS